MLKKIEDYSYNRPAHDQEYSRLLSAAVINRNFCTMLLSDPSKAIHNGYSGEKFNLSKEAEEKVTTIRATSLQEFAAKLAAL
ncbi:MAG TPA: hypothetical protein PLL88_03565 [Anaerolineaceae bacterium]|nr:hypothetical protein [Anaerolineaceae bacterium]